MKFLSVLPCLLALGCSASPPAAPSEPARGTLTLHARSRTESGPVEKVLTWEGAQTAVIICDMWDKHSCRNATRRVADMAPKADEFVKSARRRGALIVHCPSDTMAFYEGTPERALAKNAPNADAPEPIQRRPPDPANEKLPVDSTDWCDDDPPCTIIEKPYPWSREHPAIQILAGDAVSDSGREVYNLFRQRSIRNLLILGVHTNFCVLNRSFGIRQMTRLGMNVALVRDLTDCLYNPKKPPYVSHDEGTRRVIEHIERRWCPTVLSSDLTANARP